MGRALTPEPPDLRGAYRGRRVLVTGHTGFKGTWLALWLARLEARVCGLALPPAGEPSLFAAVGGEAIVERHVVADIRTLGPVRHAVDTVEPEVVFHLAAQSLVRASYRDPAGTFATNVSGTAHVLEAVRLAPSVRAVVVVTSDKCYENREWPWGYRENDRLGGHDPYAASKAGAELVVEAYRRSFFEGRAGLGCASARAGNVIGGGDWAPDRLVPDCIRALAEGKRVPVRAPDAVRPWQHVLEPLQGYLLLGAHLLADPGRYSSAWNFGPAGEDVATVRDVVAAVVAAWGEGSWDDVGAGDREAPHEARLLLLSSEKARHALGWRPRWDRDRAIAETVAWYRGWLACPADARRLCERQLDAYEASAAR